MLPLLRSSVPKVQSYQRHISARSVRLGTMLGGRSITFTACSENCARPARAIGGKWAVIYNGVPIEKYEYAAKVASDAPFVFLGRVERIKGAHTAIQIAKRTGRRLIIAGNHADMGEDRDYFDNEILPHCDNTFIEYVGPVNDLQKKEILGKAAALLFPIEWEEPFGIVMAEALACGTPIIAFKRGSVPEVVQDNVTGFICQTVEEMARKAKDVHTLDRFRCRQTAEQRFSDQVITSDYENLYLSCVGSNGNHQ